VSNIAVISVHPDDETLGCGGTILKHKKNGDMIYWIIITNIKDKKVWSRHSISERQKEIDIVSRNYGFEKTIKLNYETTKLDKVSLGGLTQNISDVFITIKPEIIYLHNRSDIHTDHKISFHAIMSASKSLNHSYIKNILMYETISETEFAPALQENVFIPNYFVDVTEFIEQKIKIMKIYKSEMKEHPFPRSERNIKALATFRGAQCGVEYSEAFMILKCIWK
jgi:N-acetylglucosamine malate deacetylase 1